MNLKKLNHPGHGDRGSDANGRVTAKPDPGREQFQPRRFRHRVKSVLRSVAG